MSISILYIVFSVIILDQLSKLLILQNLNLNQSIEIFEGFFYLTLVHNTGAAFSILKDQAFLFIAISIIAIIAILFYMHKKQERVFLKDLSLALILGGACGNLIDRVRFGYVVDFLDFRIWPVFNIADSAITIGALLLIISLLIDSKKE